MKKRANITVLPAVRLSLFAFSFLVESVCLFVCLSVCLLGCLLVCLDRSRPEVATPQTTSASCVCSLAILFLRSVSVLYFLLCFLLLLLLCNPCTLCTSFLFYACCFVPYALVPVVPERPPQLHQQQPLVSPMLISVCSQSLPVGLFFILFVLSDLTVLSVCNLCLAHVVSVIIVS